MNWDEVIDDGLKALAVVLLVLLNAFFVAAELALVRIRATQLDPLVAKGDRRAIIARHIIANIDGARINAFPNTKYDLHRCTQQSC